MRGAKRSSAHARTNSGSSPSNSTDSSPASSSSISSTAIGRPPCEPSCRCLLAYTCPCGLEPRKRAQFVVGEPPGEVAEALAVVPPDEPAPDEPGDRLVEPVR